MIKSLIDSYRCLEGYAGMAIYRDGGLLFCEGIDPDFTEKMKALFLECGSSFKSTAAMAIIRGFTISVSRLEGLLIISRFEGRFTCSPVVDPEEPEYSTGKPLARLITKEEAKKEAEYMLKQLM